jgi:hypothetical protein
MMVAVIPYAVQSAWQDMSEVALQKPQSFIEGHG